MPLLDGIIGCWSPSIRGSGYLLPDLVRGNHGTLNNMTISDWQAANAPGLSGNMVNGDATNNRIATALRLPTANMSYGGWVRPRNLTATIAKDRPFGEADSQSGATGTSVLLRTTGPYVVVRGGTGTDINASSTMANGIWYLVVVVLGSRPEVYQNGVLVGSSTGTTIASRNVGFQILVDDTLNLTNGIDGLVGEVCVWNRPLAHAEIRDWYRQGNGGIGRQLTGQTRRRVYGLAPAAGFKAYWARRQNQIIGGGV